MFPNIYGTLTFRAPPFLYIKTAEKRKGLNLGAFLCYLFCIFASLKTS